MDYEMAKKNYIKGVETVTSTAISKFFNLLIWNFFISVNDELIFHK